MLKMWERKGAMATLHWSGLCSILEVSAPAQHTALTQQQKECRHPHTQAENAVGADNVHDVTEERHDRRYAEGDEQNDKGQESPAHGFDLRVADMVKRARPNGLEPVADEHRRVDAVAHSLKQWRKKSPGKRGECGSVKSFSFLGTRKKSGQQPNECSESVPCKIVASMSTYHVEEEAEIGKGGDAIAGQIKRHGSLGKVPVGIVAQHGDNYVVYHHNAL
jgi:hypothetical protein